MSCQKASCFWRTFAKLSAPIERLVTDVLFLFFLEFVKYCVVLLVTFGFGYLIFYHGNASNANESSLVYDSKSERLSSDLIKSGSFSKFPFVVEFPTKASAESLKTPFGIRHSRPQKLKDLTP